MESVKTLGSLKKIDNISDLVKANYYEIFNPECVRKKSNWITNSNAYKFDDESFDKDLFLKDIEKNSPKLNALLDNIKKIDEDDEKKHGKKFKHFIFSDLKSGTYGAKMIASALLAIGMNMAYFAPERGAPSTPNKSAEAVSPVPSTPSLLTSLFTPSTESPKEESGKTETASTPTPSPEESGKTETASTPSPSPEESGKTETASTPSPSPEESGKTETASTPSPSPEESGKTETASTPTPSVVSTITDSFGSLFQSSENEEKEKEKEKESNQGGGKKNYLNIRLKKDDELLKTSQNNFFILSSVDVFGKPINVKMKKEILRKFNERPDNVYGDYARIIIMDSGFKEGIDLFDIKYVHIFEPQRTMADQKQVIGRGTRTCGQKGLVFHPTMGWPLYVFNYDISIPNEFKKFFNNASSGIDLYLKALNVDLRLFNFANDLEQTSIFGAVDYELNKNIHSFALSAKSKSKSTSSSKTKKSRSKSKSTSSSYTETEVETLVDSDNEITNSLNSTISTLTQDSELIEKGGAGTRVLPRSPNKRKSTTTRTIKPKLVISEPVQQLLSNYSPNTTTSELPIGDHHALRDYIKTHFSEYTWDDVKMENLCGYAGPEQTGGADLIKYSPTQDFVKNYFTPNNPIKGLLLWNSVGTGKTCSAIAAASYSFEPEEYTILWVTRTTLKSDIWKNMFEQVCNERLRLEIINGKQIPAEQSERMKLLSKSWKIRPMSYKQFSNLVSKKNKYYSDLVKINGEEDPLRKTLIIIDEAHKLYGGSDLSSLEKPDMNALHASLMNSYLVSGNQSVKLLLMTATPITQSPMELIQLLNLMRYPEQQFPEQFQTFSEKYLNDEGLFTEQGRNAFLDEIAGYISYLNREKDARQFSQPIIKEIKVPLINEKDEYLIDTFDKEYTKDLFEGNIKELKTEIDEISKTIDDDLKDLNIGKFLFLEKKCDDYKGILNKKCKKVVRAHINDLLKESKIEKNRIMDKIKTLREDLKTQTGIKTTNLAKLKKAIESNPEEYEKYKNTLYYNLKKCSKKINNREELNKNIETHPLVAEINQNMAMAEENIEKLNNEMELYIKASKNRIQNIKSMLTTDITPMEKQVLQMVLIEENANIKQLTKKNVSLKAENKKRLNITKKEYTKQKQRVIRSIAQKLKSDVTKKNKIEKQLKREELKLRKTLRKQQRIQEEIKNEFVNGLVNKYSDKMDEDLKTLETTVTNTEKEKEEQRQAKLIEKEQNKEKKMKNLLEKEQNKIIKQKEQEEKKKLKQKEQEEKKKLKQKEQEEKKLQKPQKIANAPGTIPKKKFRVTKNKIARSSKSLSNSLTRSKIRKPKMNQKKKSNDSVDYKNIEQLKHIENTQDKYNIENF
jgi:hypothetical protein